MTDETIAIIWGTIEFNQRPYTLDLDHDAVVVRHGHKSVLVTVDADEHALQFSGSRVSVLLDQGQRTESSLLDVVDELLTK